MADLSIHGGGEDGGMRVGGEKGGMRVGRGEVEKEQKQLTSFVPKRSVYSTSIIIVKLFE